MCPDAAAGYRGGGVPRRERSEGWVGAWRKMGERRASKGRRKGSGRSRYRSSRLGKLGEQRKGRGGEGEWRVPGFALLTAASSRLGKLGEQRKGRGNGGRRGLCH